MLRRVAVSVWLFAMLVIFVVGNAGHHAAMAAAGGHRMEAPVSHAEIHDHSAEAHDCEGVCGETSDKCCVMGQCLLIASAPDGLVLPVSLKSNGVALRTGIPAGASPARPFRPPA
jgi:hypothetical protein